MSAAPKFAAAGELLDPEPVVRLAVAIAKNVRDFNRERIGEAGPSRAVTLETLNALAVNVATVLAGTGDDPQARAFFELALRENLRASISDDDEPRQH